MFAALLIAGEDSGQMRPGLAKAVAEGREIVVLERRFSATVVAPVASPAPAAVPAAAPEPAPAVASAASVPEPVPVRQKVTPAPVFTLSALPSIGEDRADPHAVLPAATEVTDTGAEPGAEPVVWLVSATSVNVRQGPSTDTSVVGKLANGEAVTVVSLEGDWARIMIEGDGLEGYVAARFLIPGY